MEEILTSAINFMEEIDDNGWKLFIYTMTTEMVIPETKKAIKNFNLKTYKKIMKSNNGITLITKPIADFTGKVIDLESTNPLFDYFKDEKAALLKIRKLLNYKKEDQPYASYCGILLHAIINTHLTNKQNLNKLIELNTKNVNSKFNIIIPDNIIQPINSELINNINSTITKVLKK